MLAQTEDAQLQLQWIQKQYAFTVLLPFLFDNLQNHEEIRKFCFSSQRPFYSCVKPLDDIITFLHHHTIALAFGSVAWPCIFLVKCDVAWKCGVKISKTKKFICKNHFSHDHRTMLVLKLYSESRLAYVASICLLISRGIYSVVLLSFSVNYAYLCF